MPTTEVAERPKSKIAGFLRAWWPLLLITAFGAVLRLMYLGTPAIWGDEAAVFRRTCGSLQELFDQLKLTGFVPLHYLLYWAIAQVTTLTPVVMRLPPAIAGIFMIPAMYWLAVQMVPRRTALVAAMFVACSAFLNNYSRDAKMYSEAWLYLTLNVASLLWFLGDRRWYAWMAWVITGILMTGTHAVTAMVLPIELIIFCTHPRVHWKSGIFFVLGMAMIVAPATLYYLNFSHFHDRASNEWDATGLAWIEWYNGGRDTVSLLRYTGTHFLMNWEWPKGMDNNNIPKLALELLTTAALLMSGLIMAGLAPWRRCPASIIHWRPLLWVGAWLIVPTYGVYCSSVPESAAPWTWPWAIVTNPYGAAILVMLLLATIQFPGASWWRRVRMLLASLAVLIALLGMCCAIYTYVPVRPGSVWMPRYLGIVWPAFGIASAMLLMRLPTRPVRWVAIALVMLVNVVVCGARVFADTEPPTSQIAADILADQRPDSSVRTYVESNALKLFGGSNYASTSPGPYYMYVLSKTPTTPEDYSRRVFETFHFRSLRGSAENIVPREVAANSQLQRLIVWDRSNEDGASGSDAVLDHLGPEWKQVDDHVFIYREHWTWSQRGAFHRREYQRVDPKNPKSN